MYLCNTSLPRTCNLSLETALARPLILPQAPPLYCCMCIKLSLRVKRFVIRESPHIFLSRDLDSIFIGTFSVEYVKTAETCSFFLATFKLRHIKSSCDCSNDKRDTQLPANCVIFILSSHKTRVHCMTSKHNEATWIKDVSPAITMDDRNRPFE
jgi:hypothetical protein